MRRSPHGAEMHGLAFARASASNTAPSHAPSLLACGRHLSLQQYIAATTTSCSRLSSLAADE